VEQTTSDLQISQLHTRPTA